MAKGKIIINQDKCKGCMLCIDECKYQEISVSKKLNKFGYNIVDFNNKGNCTACTFCATICPDAAIEVRKFIEE